MMEHCLFIIFHFIFSSLLVIFLVLDVDGKGIDVIIIYYTKFKTSNLIVKNNTNSVKIYLNQTNIVYKFICPFWEFLLKNKNNSYIGYTTTTLSCCLT